MNRLRITTPWRKKRIFCISMQRTGTTSVGRFFRDHHLRWAGWPADKENHWSAAWDDGNYEKIFASPAFKACDAFEDSPWWLPGFYRILYHRFPGSRFILFERDPDQWFQSMCSHSNGSVIGMANLHCRAYRREIEYYDLLDRGLICEAIENTLGTTKAMKLTGMSDHYKSLYLLHNREVKDFFSRNDPGLLFTARLEDPEKWSKLARFLGFSISEGYDSHENRTKPS